MRERLGEAGDHLAERRRARSDAGTGGCAAPPASDCEFGARAARAHRHALEELLPLRDGAAVARGVGGGGAPPRGDEPPGVNARRHKLRGDRPSSANVGIDLPSGHPRIGTAQRLRTAASRGNRPRACRGRRAGAGRQRARGRRKSRATTPVRGKRNFDQLGRELGRKDLAVDAMLLRAVGPRGKLIFSEMDVTARAADGARNIGLLAAVASGEQRAAALERRRSEGGGTSCRRRVFGSRAAFFNRAIGSKGEECRIDRVQRLPPDAYATPRGPGSEPGVGQRDACAPSTSRDCFERGCGADQTERSWQCSTRSTTAARGRLRRRTAASPTCTARWCASSSEGRAIGWDRRRSSIGSQLKASDPGWRESCAPG